MAESSKKETGTSAGTPGAPPAAEAPRRAVPLRGRRDLWQIPVLLGAVVLLSIGLMKWVEGAPRPDFEAALKDVETLLEQREYDAALALLRDPIGTHLGEPEATEEIRQRYFLLSGDATFLSARQKEADDPAYHEQVVSMYSQARTHGAQLDPRRLARLADSLVSLGRIQDGLKEARAIPDDSAELRHRVIRRVVEECLASEKPALNTEEVLDLLSELKDDPRSSEQERLWAVTQQTRLRLKGGYPEDAIKRLIPEIARLDSRLTPEAGELFVLLGRAYLEIGDPDAAEEQLALALRVLPEGDAAAAQAQVMNGRIAQLRGEPDAARELYEMVYTRFAHTPAAQEAALGLAETRAQLGDFDGSIQAYEDVLHGLTSPELRGDTDPQTVEKSLVDRYAERFAAEDYVHALGYAALIERLYPVERLPADALLRIAETNRALGAQLLGKAGEAAGVDADEAMDPTRLDPVTLEEARGRFFTAAEYFRRHAKAAMLGDPEVAAESLWNAADAYDRAGEQELAINAFGDFVQARAQDPRAVEGRYRIARAHQSRGDYALAIKFFEEILETSPRSDMAARATVPLAQCYLLASDDADSEKAERLLLTVLDGEQFEPTAAQFRAALIELGQMYRRVGRYPQAIERLNEAITRYPELSERPEILFTLADANRLSAAEIGKMLREARPQAERIDLVRTRQERLQEALALYERVREQLEELDPRTLTSLQSTMLRNAMLYRGDCAFDLGEEAANDPAVAQAMFERAIRYYDGAAQRYADDPASLVAMVQIVNCYAALGRWREALTAHERAKSRLREMPDQVWDDANSPMARAHWERWLASSIRLDEMAAAERQEP